MGKKVLVILPKFGLGNMLLVWAKGFVYAKQNNLSFYCVGWTKIHWGALLRQENKKRWYKGYFKKNPASSWIYFSNKLLLNGKLFNPIIGEQIGDAKNLIVFNKLDTNPEMFKELRPFEREIKAALIEMLEDDLKITYGHIKAPEISVHIRRGDFKLSALATPLEYFINVIRAIRKINKSEVPVRIFTDASSEEILPLLAMPNVLLARTEADILDILWMSKSRLIILSPSSSFSYWAAFLSNAKVIIKDSDWQVRIKEDRNGYEEIRWNEASINSEIPLNLNLTTK